MKYRKKLVELVEIEAIQCHENIHYAARQAMLDKAREVIN